MAALGAASTGITHVKFERSATGTTTTLSNADGEIISGATAVLRAVVRSGSSGRLSAFSESMVDAFLDLSMNELPPSSVRASWEKYTPMLRTLINMGVQGSSTQLRHRSEVADNADVRRTLTGLEASLSSQTFLVDDRLSLADLAVFSRLTDIFPVYFSLEQRLELFPNLNRWFLTILNQPFTRTASELSSVSVGGVKRIGGQIDARPISHSVSALATGSIARNVGSKKEVSQRQLEKAKKAKAKAKAATAAPAAPVVPSVVAAASQPASNLELPKASVEERIDIVNAALGAVGISAETIRHDPAHTVDDVLKFTEGIPGGKCKNLFLKAQKKLNETDSQLYLITALHDTAVEFPKIAGALGYPKRVQLRMGKPDALVENLGVVQGHVTPVAVMNDKALKINLIFDSRMLTEEQLTVHPLTNEASTMLTPSDLTKFVQSTGHNPVIFDFAAGAIVTP